MIGFSGAIVIICVPFLITRRGAFFVMYMWAKGCLFLLNIFWGLKIRLDGKLQKEYGNLIACKHQSTLEILILSATVERPVFFLKSSLLYIPFLNLFLFRTGQLPVRRWVKNNAHLLEKAKQRLKDSNVIIFPEGTRVSLDESIPYHSGVILLAKQADVEIVPMSTNSGYFWPRRSVVKKPGVATVRVLENFKVTKSLKESLLDLQILIDTDSKALCDMIIN